MEQEEAVERVLRQEYEAGDEVVIHIVGAHNKVAPKLEGRRGIILGKVASDLYTVALIGRAPEEIRAYVKVQPDAYLLHKTVEAGQVFFTDLECLQPYVKE